MNNLIIFSNEEFGVIRTIIIDGKEYFYGVDAARALFYERPSKAVSDNCKGILTKDTILNDGGYPEKLIPEGDLYRLIVRASTQSRNKAIQERAGRFERWIFEEVLPSLRKTGAYSVAKSEKTDSYLIENPAERARRWAEEYEEKQALESRNDILQGKVQELEPKAKMFDEWMDSKLLVNFRDGAKMIGISQSQFTGWLKDNGYIYSTQSGELKPTESYVKSGLFAIKPYKNPNNGYTSSRTFITPRGLAAFKVILETNGYNRDTMKKHGGRKKNS